MGRGTAFGRQSERLSTHQFLKLKDHCQEALRGVFPDNLVLRCTIDKASHSDVDFVCAFPGAPIGSHLKGTMSQRDVFEEDPFLGRTGQTNEHEDDVLATCIAAARAVGGTHWLREGERLTIKIPCAVIDEVFSGVDEPFFQVDLVLLAPSALAFAHFTKSYSNTLVILQTALRILSPAVSLHAAHLAIQHKPFLEMKYVHVYLTNSVEELCDWLGLDYNVWANSRFRNEQDLWRWLTTIRFANGEAGALDEAWKMICDGQERPPNATHHNQDKIQGWVRFRDWLRNHRDSPYSHRNRTVPVVPREPGLCALQILERWGAVKRYEEEVEERALKAEDVRRKRQDKADRRTAQKALEDAMQLGLSFETDGQMTAAMTPELPTTLAPIAVA